MRNLKEKIGDAAVIVAILGILAFLGLLVAVGALAAVLYLLARVIGFVMLHISITHNVPL